MSPGMQWLDPLVTLSMVGAVTDRVRLGTSVLVLPYRNPVNLAAEVAALDVLSEGRFVLGIGAGWMQEEFRALGIDPGRARAAHRRAHRGAAHAAGPRIRRASAAASRGSRGSCWRPRRAPRAGRRSGSAATPTRPCAGRSAWGTDGTDSRSTRRTCREVRERLERFGEEVGRDPATLALSVVRGLIPPGREEESFVPDRRMLGGSADAIVDELGLRRAGRRGRRDPGQPAGTAGARGARVDGGRGAAASSHRGLQPPGGDGEPSGI